jgi:hypothetical protein
MRSQNGRIESDCIIGGTAMSVCIDDEGTVVDLIDYEQPEWPDWYELKALLERAARWMIDDDDFGMLDLESVTLAHGMLFGRWDNKDDRLREMIFRVESMVRWSYSEKDKKLNERLDRLIEPRKAVLH